MTLPQNWSDAADAAPPYLKLNISYTSPDLCRPYKPGLFINEVILSSFISTSEVIVDQGFYRNIKQVSDIFQANGIHVKAPAGFPVPDGFGVRADQICQLPTAEMVPSAEESKVFPELTIVQYNYHTITLLVAVYPTFPYLSI